MRDRARRFRPRFLCPALFLLILLFPVVDIRTPGHGVQESTSIFKFMGWFSQREALWL